MDNTSETDNNDDNAVDYDDLLYSSEICPYDKRPCVYPRCIACPVILDKELEEDNH